MNPIFSVPVAQRFPCKRLGNLLHLIGHIDKPEEHIQRRPQGCDILRFHGEYKGSLPFKPASGVRTGIHLITEFRIQCSEYVPCMGCRKPEGCPVKRHKDCLTQEYAEKDDKMRGYAGRMKIYRAFISLIAEPRSLKRMRCPQYGHLTLTSISTFCLHRAHLYVLAISGPDYPFICSRVRSIARWAIFMAGVCGWYAPPANLYPHFRHSQIPVPLR